MDDVRPEIEDEESASAVEAEEDIDALVLDRLAAYGHDIGPARHENQDLSVAQDHAVEAVLEADSELDGPEVDTIAPSPSEPERRRRLALRQRQDASPERGAKESSRGKHEKRIVGLKIGASQIAAAQIVNNGAPELVEVFREPLAPGLVVSGEIRDPDALGEALKRFFELHKLPKRGVRLGLANNRIGVRVSWIPRKKPTQAKRTKVNGVPAMRMRK